MRLVVPSSDAEWRDALALIAALEEWDFQQSRGLGFTREEIVGAFYSAGTGDVRRDCAPPGGCLRLAYEEGAPLGVAAYHRHDDTHCELYNVYVAPAGRGRGVARALLRQLIADATGAGYRAMRLETATFMTDAHRLYRSLGFRDREPYRVLPPRFANVTLWMERALP